MAIMITLIHSKFGAIWCRDNTCQYGTRTRRFKRSCFAYHRCQTSMKHYKTLFNAHTMFDCSRLCTTQLRRCCTLLTAQTSCAGGRHNMPRPCKFTFDLLTLKVVSESRDLGYLCASFSLPKPLCSRLRLDVRD